jgi:hypothetical protein
MINMARGHGLSVVDLFGNGRKGNRKGGVAPNDRDPNSGSTWTGRGRASLDGSCDQGRKCQEGGFPDLNSSTASRNDNAWHTRASGYPA